MFDSSLSFEEICQSTENQIRKFSRFGYALDVSIYPALGTCSWMTLLARKHGNSLCCVIIIIIKCVLDLLNRLSATLYTTGRILYCVRVIARRLLD